MYDRKKVAAGIFVFIAIFTSPFWINAVRGQEMKSLSKPNGDRCVESRDYMREKHASLLYEWRDASVRDEMRIYKSSDGREFEIGFTGTCLKCHIDSENFCVSCHESTAVKMDCFDCHFMPEDRVR